MIENKQVMARNITKYMNEKGVTASELCQALGFKHNTFSDWVNAKAYPRIDKIEMMANYFGISKACLVEESPDLSYILSKDEYILIERYRKTDQDTKKMIERLLAYSDALTKKGLK